MKKGHLKVILSPSCFAKDWIIKRKTRNKVRVRVSALPMFFSKSYCFSYLLEFFNSPPNQCSHRQGKGVAKQKTDRCGQGEGCGLKTGRNVRTPFMDDHKHIFYQHKEPLG